MLVKKSDTTVEEVPYDSTHTFESFPIHETLKKTIARKGYTTPTPIQDKAIPEILEGKDVVGIANTGTGKTAAFLIPLLHKLTQNENERILIITPTRELAIQIQEECQWLAEGLNLYSLACIGGLSISKQIQGLYRRPRVVIGTPGRCKDLYDRRKLNFADYKTVVLDEVDRMLDMGFINDIRFIVQLLPQERQSLFFSATLSDTIRSVMTSFLKDPVTISVKSRETTANVDQDIVKTDGKIKIEVLHDILIKEGFDKVLVFGRTKHGIDKLARQLHERGFRVSAIHGNKTQHQRQRALNQFKIGDVTILLATDVASRGLDIPDVTHVINYDLPETYEDYVHRIGRTGRANKKGSALSFID